MPPASPIDKNIYMRFSNEYTTDKNTYMEFKNKYINNNNMIIIDMDVLGFIRFHIIRIVRKVMGFDEHKMMKIIQTINITSLILLGKKIKLLGVSKIVELAAKKYLESIIERGKSVGVLTAQCLVQPITQLILKSQHFAGKKKSFSNGDILALNSLKTKTKTVYLHPKTTMNASVKDMTDYIKKLEHIKISDILRSKYGDSKYEIVQFTEFHKRAVSINISENTDVKSLKFFRLSLDDTKMLSSNISYFMIVSQLLANCNFIGFIVYPVSMYQIDICGNGISIPELLDWIKTILNTTITGIEGVLSTNVESINIKECIGTIHHVPTENVDIPVKTMIYLVPNKLRFFPLDVIKKNIYTKEIKIDEGRKYILSPDGTKEYKDLQSDERGKYILLPDGTKDYGLVNLKSEEDVKYVLLPYGTKDYEIEKYQYKDTVVDNLRSDDMSQQFHMSCAGKCYIDESFEYNYYVINGTMPLNELYIDEHIDHRYTISTDPYEMIDMVGISGARCSHEILYETELANNDFKLSYSHISLLCRFTLGSIPNPITSSGFEKNPGVGAFELFNFQNYKNNLSKEMVKKKTYPADSFISSIILGMSSTVAPK